MEWKRISFLIIVSFLIILNVLTLLNYKNLVDEFNHLKGQSLDVNLLKNDFKNMVFEEQMNENLIINNDIILFDENGNSHSINEILISEEPKLILRNYETACSSCFEQELAMLKEISAIIGNENIIIITTHSNTRKLNVLKNTYNIDFNIYFCENLFLPYEQEYRLYLFVSDPTLIVKHFFIPNSKFIGLSESYYSAIVKRYFNTN